MRQSLEGHSSSFLFIYFFLLLCTREYFVVCFILFPLLLGLTSLLIHGKEVLLTSALEVAEEDLMGGYAATWPLTKILDIGGTKRPPRFTSRVEGKECMGVRTGVAKQR